MRGTVAGGIFFGPGLVVILAFSAASGYVGISLCAGLAPPWARSRPEVGNPPCWSHVAGRKDPPGTASCAEGGLGYAIQSCAEGGLGDTLHATAGERGI